MTKKEFLHDVTNNDLCHRIVLWEALQLTDGNVVEFGSGHGSTPYLRKYCENWKRDFQTYDEKKEWCDVTGATMVKDWEDVNLKEVDLLFIDHAPGERRKEDLVKYKDIAKIICIHDTEPAQDHGYQMRQYFKQFKYVVEIKTNGAEAAMVSNHIDLACTIGQGNEHYKIVNG
jgi:hypothetical protein